MQDTSQRMKGNLVDNREIFLVRDWEIRPAKRMAKVSQG